MLQWKCVARVSVWRYGMKLGDTGGLWRCWWTKLANCAIPVKKLWLFSPVGPFIKPIYREVLEVLHLGHPFVMQNHVNLLIGVENSTSWASIGDAEPCKQTERCEEFCAMDIDWWCRIIQTDREVLKILCLGHPLVMQNHANWRRDVKNSASWASIGDAEPCKLTERC